MCFTWANNWRENYTFGFGIISIFNAFSCTSLLIAFKFTHLALTVRMFGQDHVIENLVTKYHFCGKKCITYKLLVLKILNFSIDLNSLTCRKQKANRSARYMKLMGYMAFDFKCIKLLPNPWLYDKIIHNYWLNPIVICKRISCKGKGGKT